MLNAKLVVVGGDAKSGEVRLRLPTVIGRGKDAGLTVPHALVSRRHTELFEKEGRLFVRDLGSLNGTFVNDKRIDGVQLLNPDQLLTLGNVTFRAVYELNEDTQSVLPSNETVEFEEIETESPVGRLESVRSPSVLPPRCDVPAPSVSQPVVPFDETVPVDSLNLKNTPDRAPSDIESSSGGSSAIESDRFSLDDHVASSPVSVSSIDGLPEGQLGVSFVGNLELSEGESQPDSSIDSVEIDLGEGVKAAEAIGNSGLGSFLNKLP